MDLRRTLLRRVCFRLMDSFRTRELERTMLHGGWLQDAGMEWSLKGHEGH